MEGKRKARERIRRESCYEKAGSKGKKCRETATLNSWEMVEAVVGRHKEHQSDRLNCELVSFCQTSSASGQKRYY